MKIDGPDRGEPNIKSLPRAVRHRIEDLMDDRKLSEKEIDHRLVRSLNDLSETGAIEALRQFDRSVDASVRSRQGFLVRC